MELVRSQIRIKIFNSYPPPLTSLSGIYSFLGGLLLFFGLMTHSTAGESWSKIDSSSSIGISNQYYNIQFSKLDGHILSVSSGTSQKEILLGQQESLLWNLVLNSHIPDIATTENISHQEQQERKFANIPNLIINPKSPSIDRFTYTWSGDGESLYLKYYSSNTEIVSIQVIPSKGNYVDFIAQVFNNYSAIALRFDFPQALLFNTKDMTQFIYPDGLGVGFNQSFYDSNRSAFGHYPSLFSDFISLESNAGNLSIFAIQKPNFFTPADLYTGGAKGHGIYEHRFITFLYPNMAWSSPTVRFVIGENTKSALQQYAHAHRFDSSMSLEAKLGKKLFKQISENITLKADIREVGSFEHTNQLLADMPSNTLFHPVSYWEKGFDKNYPDFLPPDKDLGGREQFYNLINTAHKKDMLVMPYINPTWWNESPSLNQLDREKISSRKLDGTLQKEWYNENYGYVVTPTHDDVRRSLIQMITEFRKVYSLDMLFEDQLGARPWLYDRNPRALYPTQYVQGIIDMARKHSQSLPIYTERGFDQLIPFISGFCGVPNPIYPEFSECNNKWGKGNWEIYPLALYLAHDKVAFYQHDLSIETMSDSIEKVTWNLVHGHGLTFNLNRNPSSEDKDWINTLAKLQKILGSQFIGAPFTSYTHNENNTILSQIGDLYILGNFSDQLLSPSLLKDTDITIPPGGFLIIDSSLNPIAGVFTKYGDKNYIYPTLVLFASGHKNKIQSELTISTNNLTFFPMYPTQMNTIKKQSSPFPEKVMTNPNLFVPSTPQIINEYTNSQGNKEILFMNNNLCAAVTPAWGGRITFLSKQPSLANLLYLSPDSLSEQWNHKSWLEYGGINDWFPGEFPGSVWSNDWHYQTLNNGGNNVQVLFWTDTPDNFRINKLITLRDNKNYLEVHYEIQNISDITQSFTLNTHPDFGLGLEGVAALSNSLFIPTEQGNFDIPITRNFEKFELPVRENYCVTYDKSTKNYIIQQFDKSFFDRIGVYQGYNFYTMELLGKQKTLAPQEKISFTIYYIVGQGDWNSPLSLVETSI